MGAGGILLKLNKSMAESLELRRTSFLECHQHKPNVAVIQALPSAFRV